MVDLSNNKRSKSKSFANDTIVLEHQNLSNYNIDMKQDSGNKSSNFNKK